MEAAQKVVRQSELYETLSLNGEAVLNEEQMTELLKAAGLQCQKWYYDRQVELVYGPAC